jgi:hypothetical protein
MNVIQKSGLIESQDFERYSRSNGLALACLGLQLEVSRVHESFLGPVRLLIESGATHSLLESFQ